LLKPRDEVWVDRWLSVGVAARGFGAALLRLADPKHAVQQPVRVLRPSVLGDEQEDAPVGCFKGGEKPPRRVQIESADAGDDRAS
jgi:hypothetical protein